MARLNSVASFRGTTKTEDGNLTCGKCRGKVTPGDSYRWWANRLPGSRGSSRNIRCAKPECTPTAADMTPGRAGELLRLQADGHEQISQAESVEDLLAVAESLADEVENMATELTDGADNIEDGFGHETQQSTELRERGENMEGYAQELRDVDLEEECDEAEEFDEEAVTDRLREELADDDGDLDEQELGEAVAKARSEHEDEQEELLANHLEEQREKVRELLDTVDVW